MSNTPATPEEFARIFEGSPAGERVFDDLVRRFARSPVYSGGIDGIRESDRRAGQREVVEFITRRINQAHGVEPSDPNAE